VYTGAALLATGVLVLCEITLYFGYIFPNDAVLGWPRAECVVNTSSFTLQPRERCLSRRGASSGADDCHLVYRAHVRVRTVGSSAAYERELLAFDTVFGDFSRSARQPTQFIRRFNQTLPPPPPLLPPTAHAAPDSDVPSSSSRQLASIRASGSRPPSSAAFG
jgi:hypothetical protein